MLIEFDQAIVSTPQAEVLRGVSLLLAGRRVGIVGPNGAGKSTLARLVNGLVLPTSGSVRVGGLDTRQDLKAVRRQVGFVFQNPENQIVFPIVREDLAFGLKHLEPDRGQRETRIDAQLAALGVAHLADRTSHTLSAASANWWPWRLCWSCGRRWWCSTSPPPSWTCATATGCATL